MSNISRIAKPNMSKITITNNSNSSTKNYTSDQVSGAVCESVEIFDEKGNQGSNAGNQGVVPTHPGADSEIETFINSPEFDKILEDGYDYMAKTGAAVLTDSMSFLGFDKEAMDKTEKGMADIYAKVMPYSKLMVKAMAYSSYENTKFLADISVSCKSALEGITEFGENIGDGVVQLSGNLGSLAAKGWDFFAGTHYSEDVEKNVKNFVETDYTSRLFDNVYTDWEREHSHNFEGIRSTVKNTARATTEIAVATLIPIPGVGAGINALAGYGRSSQSAYQDGADFWGASGKAAVDALWSGATSYVLGQLNVATEGCSAVTQIFSKAGSFGAVGFANPFVQAIGDTTYKKSYVDENGNEIQGMGVLDKIMHNYNNRGGLEASLKEGATNAAAGMIQGVLSAKSGQKKYSQDSNTEPNTAPTYSYLDDPDIVVDSSGRFYRKSQFENEDWVRQNNARISAEIQAREQAARQQMATISEEVGRRFEEEQMRYASGYAVPNNAGPLDPSMLTYPGRFAGSGYNSSGMYNGSNYGSSHQSNSSNFNTYYNQYSDYK